MDKECYVDQMIHVYGEDAIDIACEIRGGMLLCSNRRCGVSFPMRTFLTCNGWPHDSLTTTKPQE